MNNREKNTYVKDRITDTLMELLCEKDVQAISISELTEAAGVGRASFYRNFASIEDVLFQHDRFLLQEWTRADTAKDKPFTLDMVASLFEHYRNHADFYLLLYRNGLSKAMLHTVKECCGLYTSLSPTEIYTKELVA